jgi:hypothetical protein
VSYRDNGSDEFREKMAPDTTGDQHIPSSEERGSAEDILDSAFNTNTI